MLKIYCDAIEHGLSKQVEIREYAKKHFSGGVSPRSLTKIRRVLSFWRLSEKDAVPVLKKLIANDVTLYEADREALKSIKNFERYFLNVVDGLGAV